MNKLKLRSASSLHVAFCSPSLLKPHWFAVGWIDPNSKHCTKIYSSGNTNPSWKTKFLFDVDDRSSNLQDLSLTVEIHKRDPIFLRDKLHGKATIMLNEFLVKFLRETDAFRTRFEEAGSWKLRKQNSGRPQGFVDVSVHISQEGEAFASHSGRNEFDYTDQGSKITLTIENGLVLSYPTQSQPLLPPLHTPSDSGSVPTLLLRSRSRR